MFAGAASIPDWTGAVPTSLKASKGWEKGTQGHLLSPEPYEPGGTENFSIFSIRSEVLYEVD